MPAERRFRLIADCRGDGRYLAAFRKQSRGELHAPQGGIA
jgi:hypothetical protein